jgi:uncharacterized protein (DUF1330 family)
MKSRYAVALAFVTGVAGAITVQNLQAKPKPPVYVVIDIDEITDTDGFKALLKAGPANIAAVKMSDGHYLARTDKITALDGSAPKRFILIAFDSMEKAKAFNADIKETNAMRVKTTKSRAFIAEGM